MTDIKCSLVSDFDPEDTPDHDDIFPDDDDFPFDNIKRVIFKSTVYFNGKEIRCYNVTYYRNNMISKVMLYKFGKLHSEKEPAFTQYFRNSNEIKSEIYFLEGKKHRPEYKGPAEMIMTRNRKGRFTPKVKYFEHGEPLEE